MLFKKGFFLPPASHNSCCNNTMLHRCGCVCFWLARLGSCEAGLQSMLWGVASQQAGFTRSTEVQSDDGGQQQGVLRRLCG